MNAPYSLETFRIGSQHPALPGHFPGRPVVPGVVLLDRVAGALERRHARRIASLVQVKFLAPLLPGEDVELRLDDHGDSVHFSVSRNEVLLATGVVTLAAAASASILYDGRAP